MNLNPVPKGLPGKVRYETCKHQGAVSASLPGRRDAALRGGTGGTTQ
jgi:hypothetical protein